MTAEHPRNLFVGADAADEQVGGAFVVGLLASGDGIAESVDDFVVVVEEGGEHLCAVEFVVFLFEIRQGEEFPHGAGGALVDHADALGEVVDGVGEVVVLGFEEEVEGAEAGVDDIPMEVLCFDVEDVGVGKDFC